jgi:hypothetical protein
LRGGSGFTPEALRRRARALTAAAVRLERRRGLLLREVTLTLDLAEKLEAIPTEPDDAVVPRATLPPQR